MFATRVSAMWFKGVLRYADAASLEAALDAVQALIDGEDCELSTLVEDGQLARRGLELRVHIDTACDPDIYLAYETIIEALAAHALAGGVEGAIEGAERTETYAARRTEAVRAA